jgi:Capsule assembly protein Wzi/PAP2 superfamily
VRLNLQRKFVAALTVALLAGVALGQSADSRVPASPDRHPSIGQDTKTLLLGVVRDQKTIWTAPAHLKWHDAEWLVPFAGVTAGFLATDDDVANTVARHPRFESKASTLSNAGLALGMGSAGAFYLAGRWSDDAHKRETGLLSTEALIDSLGVFEPVKFAARRTRPFQNTPADGDFFAGGSSFPSGHATMAFSIATVIAHEYPGPATQVLAYGGASVVAISRVIAQKHFPSDVLVGSTLGYLIGRSVYRNHHDHELPGAEWGSFERDENGTRSRDGASNYVPIDSWVYPALDRLASMGFIKSAFASMRPWTRMECARLLDEAEPNVPEQGDVFRTTQRLREEFAPELANFGEGTLPSGQIESVYGRYEQIAGPALTDGYHFGQTIVDDFGRPNRQGGNLVTGMSLRANAGAFVLYVRGEYQQSPGTHGLSSATEQQIAVADTTLVQPSGDLRRVRQFRLLDTYVGLGLSKWLVTFGKQTLWWAPTRTTALMFSNNAEPMPMFRVNQTSPSALPGLLKYLGPVRTEFFFGRILGQRFISPLFDITPVVVGDHNQPFIHGERISFKPTENFEFGLSRTALLGGPQLPLTLRTVARSYFSTTNVTAATDPGDRRAGFDFSYRIPGLRNWLTLYNDSLIEDEISPIGYPRQSAMNPGIYLPRIPKLNRLDLRVEAAYTDLPNLRAVGFFYWNTKYRSGYTNRGNIIGSWVGRQGRAITASSTYWLGADKNINLRYRHAEASSDFLQGGNIDDLSARATLPLKPGLYLIAAVQAERWRFPLIATGAKTDVSSSLELRFTPGAHK